VGDRWRGDARSRGSLDYRGRDEDGLDALQRPVAIDVGQAWITHARNHAQPILRYEQFETLKDWYAEEVRQLNHTFAEDGGGSDMPVPATVRELGAAVKMAIAFARVHLREEVTGEDVERAKKLGKRLVKQHWTGERFDAAKNVSSAGSLTQEERYDAVTEMLRDADGLTLDEVRERAGEHGLDASKAEHAVEKLARKGELYQPTQGVFEVA